MRACGVLLLLCAGLTAAAEQSFNLNDLLRAEAIGDVAYLPNGSGLLIEKRGPYEARPNVGTMTLEDGHGTGAVYLAREGEPPRLLFPQHSDSGYWFGEFSPDGKRVIVYRLTEGHASLGVAELESTKTIWFDIPPDYRSGEKEAAWISNIELGYIGITDAGVPFGDNKQGTAAQLIGRWNRTWRGESSVSVLESHARGEITSVPQPYTVLVKADVRTSIATALRRATYRGLIPSEDRRWLLTYEEIGLRQLKATHRWQDPRLRRPVVIDTQTWKVVELCNTCDAILGSGRWEAGGDRLTMMVSQEGSFDDRSLHLFQWNRKRFDRMLVDQHWTFACGTSRADVPPIFAAFGRSFAFGSEETEVPRSRWAQCAGSGPLKLAKWEDDRWSSISGNLKLDSADIVGASKTDLYVLAGGDLWEIGPNRRRNMTKRRFGLLSPWSIGRLHALDIARSEIRYGYSIPRRWTVLQSDEQILLVGLKPFSLTALNKPIGTAILAATDPRRGRALFRVRSSGTELVEMSTTNRQTSILRINDWLTPTMVPRQRSIDYSIPNGEPRSSCLMLPPDSTKRALPVIVSVYPGQDGHCPTSAGDPWAGADPRSGFPLTDALLPANGYAVFYIAMPEMSGASGVPAADRDRLLPAAVDSAIDAAGHTGLIDVNRLGLLGMSQGMRVALEVLIRTKRFRAAVVAFGLSDLISHYGSSSLRERMDPDSQAYGNAARYEHFSDDHIGTPPWANPSGYIDASPVLHSNAIDTPLLIVGSDLDLFGLGQSEELFSALYRQGKEARCVTLWGEAHGPSSPGNIRVYWSEVLGWYGKWLRSVNDLTVPPAAAYGQ